MRKEVFSRKLRGKEDEGKESLSEPPLRHTGEGCPVWR